VARGTVPAIHPHRIIPSARRRPIKHTQLKQERLAIQLLSHRFFDSAKQVAISAGRGEEQERLRVSVPPHTPRNHHHLPIRPTAPFHHLPVPSLCHIHPSRSPFEVWVVLITDNYTTRLKGNHQTLSVKTTFSSDKNLSSPPIYLPPPSLLILDTKTPSHSSPRVVRPPWRRRRSCRSRAAVHTSRVACMWAMALGIHSEIRTCCRISLG
jgi:hypothetical protein